MAEHPHVTLVRRGYEALVRGDMDAMSQFAKGDVGFSIAGHHPLSGGYEGLDSSREYYRRMGDLVSGNVKFQLEHVFTDGRGRVIAVHRTTARRDGKELDQLHATLFTIEDDRVVSINVLDEDMDASNRFWS